MKEEYLLLKVVDIDFDRENPRIKMALEKYGDALNAERIHFALKTATPESPNSTSSFEQLRGSIRAYGGIDQPIRVVEKDGKSICIDGNTRLAIYKEFHEKDIVGDWSRIPSFLVRNVEQVDIEKIRVSAHLVGPRQWPAYGKARYLHYLYNEQFMDPEQMVALCGGNKKDIERQIEAYEDMNKYYRNVVDDSTFRVDRFSGFVELQKTGIKNAIFEAGFELEDFGKWIHNGQISRLENVRELSKVLRDAEAVEIFVNGGVNSIKQAARHIDDKLRTDPRQQRENILLKDAPLYLLAQTLTRKIDDLVFSELRRLQASEDEDATETISSIRSLSLALEELMSSVGEQ